MDYNVIIDFWFDEISPQQWWSKDAVFDQLIDQHFSKIHAQAVSGELFTWRKQALGRLAEVIVIDQFSRNLFREDPCGYAYDGMALVLAQEAIALGMDQDFTALQQAALYLPFMHSESLVIHQQAVVLFSAEGLESNLAYEYKHKAIIDQFGRYPHRNTVLGRQSTAAEIEFLQQPGSSF